MFSLLSVIASILLYVLAPAEYSFSFVVLVTLAFLTQTIIFCIRKSKCNYINFYTIFFVSYFFVNFFYAAVLYPIDPKYFPVFTLPFNHEVINKCTALAWVASSCFILGANRHVHIQQIQTVNKLSFIYKHEFITLITAMMIMFFIATVGREFLAGNFDGHSSISLYILQLVTCAFLLASIIFFRDYEHQVRKAFFYTVVVGYVMLFLGVGDRGPALSLLILCLALYSQYVKKIELKYLITIIFFGFVLMYAIGQGRTTDVTTLDGNNIVTRGLDNFNFNMDSYYKMTGGFASNAFTLYFGVDYVEGNGFNFGGTFLKSIISVLPFLQGLLNTTFDFNVQSSPELFTREALGPYASWGVGTNLISDVYITFGSLGCIIIFYFFGRFVETARINMIFKDTIKSNIIYFGLISYAISYPRINLLAPLKFIIWAYFIYLVLKFLKLVKPKPRYV